MKFPEISVIMAVHNTEKYLTEAIDSILNQTFRNFEFIIINDVSTDNSLKIIKRYMKNDKRIKLINNIKNVGPAISRNNGLRIAKGKYIAIMDSDDISLPKRFEIQYDFLQKNTDIFLIGGQIIRIDEHGSYISKSNLILDERLIKEKLRREVCIFHPTIMFRNEGIHLYRKKFIYAQDYDFYLRLLSKNKRILNIPRILVKYRISPNAISWSKSGKQRALLEKAKEFYKQRLIYGKDDYKIFEPKSLSNIYKPNDKIILEAEMRANLKINDLKKVRIFYRKYFENYGFINKFTIYYILSLTNKKFINLLRKIISS